MRASFLVGKKIVTRVIHYSQFKSHKPNSALIGLITHAVFVACSLCALHLAYVPSFPIPNSEYKESTKQSYLRRLSAGTGELYILGNLGLVLIWSCFVSCLLFLLFYASLRSLCSGTHRRNLWLVCSITQSIINIITIQ